MYGVLIGLCHTLIKRISAIYTFKYKDIKRTKKLHTFAYYLDFVSHLRTTKINSKGYIFGNKSSSNHSNRFSNLELIEYLETQ